MVFSSNPLALSVPDPVFESWLRDKGYLEILDQKTSDLHRISAITNTTNSSSSSSSTTTTTSSSTSQAPATVSYGIFIFLFSHFKTLVSIFTFNPFSKLTTNDFSGNTPSWTEAFIGSLNSYSFPSSPAQARLRAHENVKRFARNYVSLFILFFACSLYQMPVALVGLLLSLALWDIFKYLGDQWGLDRYPVLRQTLVRVAQCATSVILFFSNVQVAILCSLGVSYAVLISHASLRKLTSTKQSAQSDRNRRNQ
ncbi:hypothetical protein M9H77_21837 [Catharanthus roseus]|uniref:Uncharacterized protein n=1 Tax=Catharanthus roseus TaxID=4058 RepID=A0ACC0ANU9_CATRO|nr:hypothetical protein M9H77_21837 [Catharanthus roseus]